MLIDKLNYAQNDIYKYKL